MRNRRIFALAASAVIAMTLVGCASAVDSVPVPQQEAAVSKPDIVKSPQVLYEVRPVDNTTMESIRSCNREPGSGVLLSFDDEGTPEQVADILAALREYNAQAAFFPTGDWVLENLEIIDQMKAEGHIVGNHTQTHARLGQLSAEDPDQFYAEIYPLEGVANTNPMWLRPPYEDASHDPLVQERLTEKGIQMCTWTADTYDWSGDSVDTMMQRLIVGDEFSPNPLSHDGVVLLHLGTEHAATMVGEIVTYLESQNIKVASLSS